MPSNNFFLDSLMAKRLLDLTTAALGLTILAVPLVALAIAIKIESPGPLIFSQLRIGQFGRPFRMFKFRTMAHQSDVDSQITVGGDSRITARSATTIQRPVGQHEFGGSTARGS